MKSKSECFPSFPWDKEQGKDICSDHLYLTLCGMFQPEKRGKKKK